MADKERATVMLLRGSNEDRLRQAIAQGLVSKDVQQDIEEALTAAEDARVYAETLQRQLEREEDLNKALESDIKALEKQAKQDAEYYEKAVAAYKREEKRAGEKADRAEAFVIALIGALAFIAANIIGHFVFGLFFK